MPGASYAQCQLCGPAETAILSDQTQPDRPLTIEIESGIDFSRVAIVGQGGGVVALDAHSGGRLVSGALVDLGGMGYSGTVRLSGDPGRLIRVEMPQSAILSAPDGSIAELRDIVTDLQPTPRLGPDGRLSFRFGGRLTVNGQVSGDLRGRIAIRADYE
ncbi:DUF4402 domain-containing protein [Sphingobium boeckii]|uniref:DUF4402 domain-containing protein n=1 Tax=Sphingobium boeckii TaxID=1082345 RepID=A0A7W9AE73_9SPHN|nr:DUF4402 domain-containing protein [Sphingobium boeckii]MBB5684070.1 hypothetical protein [Sphingobium boeckii]